MTACHMSLGSIQTTAALLVLSSTSIRGPAAVFRTVFSPVRPTETEQHCLMLLEVCERIALLYM